jgi:hypothetical protein
VFTGQEYEGLLKAVEHASGSADKGKALENLLSYLLRRVPGFLDMERNQLNAFGTEELDIAVIHARHRDGFGFLPSVVLVECKNWSEPVDSQAVAYFAQIVRNRGCEVGILVAASGITGSSAVPTAGLFEMAVALARDGIKVLVVTLDDLRGVRSIEDFVLLVRRRMLRVVASGSYMP